MVQAFTFTIPAAEVPDILKEEALKQCIPIEDFLKLGLCPLMRHLSPAESWALLVAVGLVVVVISWRVTLWIAPR